MAPTIATYPQRAKTRNARKRPDVSVMVLSDEWDDAWVQVAQGKSLLRITPTRWSTVSTGGFPPEVAERA